MCDEEACFDGKKRKQKKRFWMKEWFEKLATRTCT
jgi:hypothetical protein